MGVREKGGNRRKQRDERETRPGGRGGRRRMNRPCSQRGSQQGKVVVSSTLGQVTTQCLPGSASTAHQAAGGKKRVSGQGRTKGSWEKRGGESITLVGDNRETDRQR